MKPLILAAALAIAQPAAAEVFAWLPNNANGHIILTTILGGPCAPPAMGAIAQSGSGDARLLGCWTYEAPHIVIRYTDGDTRVYPADGWRINPKFIKQSDPKTF